MSSPLTAESILHTYRALAKKNGGPVGQRVFSKETGIPRARWTGGHWRSWTEFVEAAGYSAIGADQRIPDEVLFRSFAELALERGVLPNDGDLNLKSKSEPSFPGKSAFKRFGQRDVLLRAVAAFCEGKPEFAAVSDMLVDHISTRHHHRVDALRVTGFVYLLRSGKNFKIGRTNAAGRRLRELSIQLPKKPDTVHVIETDDPEGIEAYWHRRFADKRQGGEWFTLAPDDVRAFKKRRFQ